MFTLGNINTRRKRESYREVANKSHAKKKWIHQNLIKKYLTNRYVKVTLRVVKVTKRIINVTDFTIKSSKNDFEKNA